MNLNIINSDDIPDIKDLKLIEENLKKKEY